MRTIQVFILRLLVDPKGPSALRGTLEPVPEGQPVPFTGQRRLLSLLSELSRLTSATEANLQPGQREPEARQAGSRI